MKSSPNGVGLFVALVVSTLLVVGWPDPAEEVAHEASPAAEVAPAEPVFTVVGDTWQLPGYGLRMALPADWTPLERSGRPYLYKNPDTPLAGSVNVLGLPNLRGLDFDALRAENRFVLEQSEELELISIEDVLVSDLPALRIDYRGASAGGEAMHFLGVVMLAGSRQIVVTVAGREADWAGLEGTALACLESLDRLP